MAYVDYNSIATGLIASTHTPQRKIAALRRLVAEGATASNGFVCQDCGSRKIIAKGIRRQFVLVCQDCGHKWRP